jgi:hypothetical protein
METLNVVVLCVIAASLGAAAMSLYLTKTAVGKAAQKEISRHYGTERMREFLGRSLTQFPEDIKNVSPTFCDIYIQAQMAEQEGYSQICGLGYGKAIEFLIKDYAIALNPTEAERIKSATLSVCISNHIPDEAIRNSSDLARWLRNDETHYLRKFESHDANDLRSLIDIAVLLIRQAQMKSKIEQELQERRDAMEKDKKNKS